MPRGKKQFPHTSDDDSDDMDTSSKGEKKIAKKDWRLPKKSRRHRSKTQSSDDEVSPPRTPTKQGASARVLSPRRTPGKEGAMTSPRLRSRRERLLSPIRSLTTAFHRHSLRSDSPSRRADVAPYPVTPGKMKKALKFQADFVQAPILPEKPDTPTRRGAHGYNTRHAPLPKPSVKNACDVTGSVGAAAAVPDLNFKIPARQWSSSHVMTRSQASVCGPSSFYDSRDSPLVGTADGRIKMRQEDAENRSTPSALYKGIGSYMSSASESDVSQGGVERDSEYTDDRYLEAYSGVHENIAALNDVGIRHDGDVNTWLNPTVTVDQAIFLVRMLNDADYILSNPAPTNLHLYFDDASTFLCYPLKSWREQAKEHVNFLRCGGVTQCAKPSYLINPGLSLKQCEVVQSILKVFQLLFETNV